jgi:hypothetical protein
MSSLYLYNALRGSKGEQGENDDLYYLTRILNFRNEFQLGRFPDEEFSERLLEVIQKHPSFKDISRVCVSIAFPLSNKIGVLSSATTNEENLMDSNYSCYVSRTTSLNSIEKGSVRVYDNIDEIIDKYIEEGKPVQRSLHYLNKMGVKSGLTVKLETRALNGYLFINSNTPGYFKDVPKNCATYLNLLELVVSEYFNQKTEDFYAVSNIETYLHKFPSSKLLSNAHLYGEEGLFEISKFISYYMEDTVNLTINDNTDKKFLVPWGQISLITSMLLRELGFLTGIELNITLLDESDEMKIQLASPEFSNKVEELSFDHYRGIRKFARKLGIELIKQKDTFLFSLKVDYNVSSEEVGYSTFQQ